MTYIGIDLHREFFVAHVENRDGEKLLSQKYPNSLESVGELTGRFPNSKVVVEATRNWMWFVRAVRAGGCNITMAHPFRTKAIAAAKIKTDAIDAATLCQLLRANLIPESYIASDSEVDDRELSRGRVNMVHDRTLLKNRIKAILGKENLTFPGSDLFGKKGRIWLNGQCLSQGKELMVENYLNLMDGVEERLKKVDGAIKQKGGNNPRANLLTTIPGIGVTTAFLLASEIGSIDRFANSKKFASYFGLTPRLSQSGNHAYYGRITKVGNPYVRWALVQTAQRWVRMHKNSRVWFDRLSYRAGKKKAIVALARKISTIVYSVLKYKRPFSLNFEVQKVSPAILPESS